MKNIGILLFILTFTTTVFSQKNDDAVILTINDEEITKSEFLQTYLKNNNDPSFEKEALDDYMELYKKFKLKVAEAEELGYDTIPSLVKELEGYKEQLARPYLVDSSKNTELVKEAYERAKKEVRASHILVKVAEDASPEDTLEAYNRIMKIKKRIEGGEDFGEVAASKKGSDDPSAIKNKGDLGYFTAFQMVYPFESAAYNTPVGEISDPVRTKYGYHIINVVDKRDARGTINAAHIMVAAPKDSDKSELVNAQKKIDEIYQKLEAGESFENLARLHSDDQGSKNKGGKLPTFGSGTSQRMVTEFEDAAFALKEDGEYSEPFQTDYGYHIVKRIDYKPLAPFSEMKSELQSKVNKGDRGQQTQASFISKLKSENKFKDKGSKRLDWFYENVDSTIFKGKWEAPELDKNKWMFKYNKEKFDQAAFRNYLVDNQRRGKKTNIKNYVNEKYKAWQDQVIIENEKSTLADKHVSYKALINEYHDGVLLYEIMKDKVWDKALKDTVGLQEFYAKNQDKYQWPERIDALVYSSGKKEIIDSTYQLLKSQDTLSAKEVLNKMNSESQLNLNLKENKFIQNKTPYLKDKSLKEGYNEIFEFEGNYYLVEVKERLAAGSKTLAEARGSVIQDYQTQLEKDWLEELRKKHIITVQNEVLYSLGE
ncbi:MAG: peptidylprolyl isomerase [Brumimicrobium sp.]